MNLDSFVGANLVDEFVDYDPKTGFFTPKLWKKAIFPYQLGFDPTFTSGALSIPASGRVSTRYTIPFASPSNLGQGAGTPFRAHSITFADSTDGTAAAAFTCQLQDLADKTQFMNVPCHIRNLAGTAQLAARIPEPLLIPSMHSLVAQFAKVSGGATTARMYLNGRLYNPWDPQLLRYEEHRCLLQDLIQKLILRRQYIYPFWLSSDDGSLSGSVTVPASGTAEVDVDVGDDGHLELTHWMSVETSTSYLVNVLDPDTKRSLTNGQVHRSAAIGTAQNPQRLAVPWLIAAGKRLRFQFTDLSASTNVIFNTFRGQRIRAPLKSVEEVKKEFEIPAAMAH